MTDCTKPHNFKRIIIPHVMMGLWLAHFFAMITRVRSYYSSHSNLIHNCVSSTLFLWVIVFLLKQTQMNHSFCSVFSQPFISLFQPFWVSSFLAFTFSLKFPNSFYIFKSILSSIIFKMFNSFFFAFYHIFLQFVYYSCVLLKSQTENNFVIL